MNKCIGFEITCKIVYSCSYEKVLSNLEKSPISFWDTQNITTNDLYT